MVVSLRRDIYLRRYLTDFIQMLVPRLSREDIRLAVSTTDAGRSR